MEFVYKARWARAIGVSNFTKEHLEDLLSSCEVAPMMNQVECHPYLARKELVSFCQERGIQVTAYSPMACGKANVVEDERIVALAAKKGVSPGKVVLCWLVQRGIVVIPRSWSPARLRDNLDLRKDLLTEAEMEIMNGLDRGQCMLPDPHLIP